jgi:hypothetical protein
LEKEIEFIIQKLISQKKFRIAVKHILRERAERGFTIEELINALKNGFLYKIQKPHRVLWGCYDEFKNLVVLSLWLLDEQGEFAVNWHKSKAIIIDMVHVKTAYRKELV